MERHISRDTGAGPGDEGTDDDASHKGIIRRTVDFDIVYSN